MSRDQKPAVRQAIESLGYGNLAVLSEKNRENKIITEADLLNAQSLPTVRMPNASGFTSPDPRPDAP